MGGFDCCVNGEHSAAPRFKADIHSLTRSLIWHAKVTNDIQTRLIKAREYARGRIGDAQLLAILDTRTPEHDGFDHCAGCQAAYQARTSEEA